MRRLRLKYSDEDESAEAKINEEFSLKVTEEYFFGLAHVKEVLGKLAATAGKLHAFWQKN